MREKSEEHVGWRRHARKTLLENMVAHAITVDVEFGRGGVLYDGGGRYESHRYQDHAR